MRHFLSLLRFELRYHVYGPTFFVSFGVFFLLSFFATASSRVSIGGGSAVFLNAPSAIALTLGVLGLFGMFIPAAILSSSVLRDQEFRTEEQFHATPIHPRMFILGRLSGGLLASWLAFASVPLGIYLASLMPWINPERLGPTPLISYLKLYITIGVVNVTVIGVLLFTVANLTRSMLATYIALTVFLVAYIAGNNALDQPQYRQFAAIIDPMGLNAMEYITRYWTPAERNTKMVELTGSLLVNRILWSSFAFALLLFNTLRFSFTKKHRKATSIDVLDTSSPPSIAVLISQKPEPHPALRQLTTRISFECRNVFRSPALWILLMLGLVNTVAALLLGMNLAYGVRSHPVTRVMFTTVAGGFSIIPLIVLIYYASELVWRERTAKVHEVIDATPTPSWVFVLSKFMALTLVIFILYGVATVCAIIVQIIKGHPDLELNQYALRFILEFFIPTILIAVLCLFAQVVFNNRWLGMLTIVLYIVVTLSAASFGYDHNLLIYGNAPSSSYSDMNGYGHFLAITSWYYLYWAFWALILGVFSYVLWNRGQLQPLRLRAHNLLHMSRASRTLLLIGVVGATITGGWIFYNTNVLNTYTNVIRREHRALDFEDKYLEKYGYALSPKIVAVELTADLYPQDRKAEFAGSYTVINTTDAPLSSLLIDYDYQVEVLEQSMPGAQVVEEDLSHMVYHMALDPPMAPEEQRTFKFHVLRENLGFRNEDNVSSVNWNGTFVQGGIILPSFGFNDRKLLRPRNDRRRYGREPLPRLPDLNDQRFFTRNMLRSDSDFVNFGVTLSTTDDQIAIAPGYLVKEWTENGRRYFRYQMDTPINNFFSFQSAKYAIKEDYWEDVKLQVFYHPKHTYNVDDMMRSMKASFAYFTQAFSPYQFTHMRVLEFPAYERFAQSYANTVPYSEGLGFVLDQQDEKDINVVFYVTAHEVAHQWWGHQVTPAAVQGGTMPVESFAQYSALMVMEKAYGAHAMRRFLKKELDRYLRGRANEPEAEKPLYRVENQPYIHYQKGSLVMYALKDYIGEDVVNRSLSRFIKEHGYKTDPYPRSTDYLAILKSETDPKHHELISELFEKIILFDLKVLDSQVTARSDGRYAVSITIQAAKLESTEKGEESELPLEMPIDIGIFSTPLAEVYKGDEHVLIMEKHVIKSGKTTFHFIVDTPPVEVGIDPYNKLIDRVTDDNLRRVSLSSATES